MLPSPPIIRLFKAHCSRLINNSQLLLSICHKIYIGKSCNSKCYISYAEVIFKRCSLFYRIFLNVSLYKVGLLDISGDLISTAVMGMWCN